MQRPIYSSDPSPKYLSEEELGLLYQSVSLVLRKPLYWLTLFMCMSHAGLRSAEAMNLKLADIDLKNRIIQIKEQKNGVRNERISIPEKLANALNLHIKRYFYRIDLHPEKYIFFSRPNSISGHVTYTQLHTNFQKLVKYCGLEDIYNHKFVPGLFGDRKLNMNRITCHSLRHYYITKIYKSTDIIHAQRCARHKSIGSTLRYVYSNFEDKEEATNKAFPAMKQETPEYLLSDEDLIMKMLEIKKLYIERQKVKKNLESKQNDKTRSI